MTKVIKETDSEIKRTAKSWIKLVCTKEEFAQIAKEIQQNKVSWESYFLEVLHSGLFPESYFL